MAGTRDKLIHEYFGIDYDIIENKILGLDYFQGEIIFESKGDHLGS